MALRYSFGGGVVIFYMVRECKNDVVVPLIGGKG